MKSKFLSLFLAAGLFITGALSSGCKTIISGKEAPQPQKEYVIDESRVRQIAVVCELAGYNGTYLYLVDNPEKADIFRDVVSNLDIVIKQGLTIESFLEVVKNLPVKELQSDKGVVIVDSAIILWGVFKGDVVNLNKLEQAEKLTPVALGLRNGIARALKIDPLVL